MDLITYARNKRGFLSDEEIHLLQSWFQSVSGNSRTPVFSCARGWGKANLINLFVDYCSEHMNIDLKNATNTGEKKND